MEEKQSKFLLIGYGNPGRLDDGLGPALAEEVGKLGLAQLTVESDYQLTVEDAAQIAEYDLVVFADASVSGPEPYGFSKVDSDQEAHASFSTHSVSAEAVLALAESLFGRRPEAYMLSIRGYEYNEFGERLSDRARANLAAAVQFLREFLESGGSPVS